jgi:tetratricopeptide (TPR) repeat protein
MDDKNKKILKMVKSQVKEMKAEGDCLMKKSHYADASEHYIQATKVIMKQNDVIQQKLQPWSLVLLSLEASCHLKTGSYVQCVEVATRAIKMNEKADAKLHYCRAQAYEQIGNLEEASSDGKKANEIDGNSGAYHDAVLLAHRCDVRRLGVLRGPKPRPQDFKIEKVLGEGNYTNVYKAVSIYDENEKFAMKTVTFKQIEKTERRHKNVKNELVMEREALVMMDHPNVVHLYHTFKDANALYFLFEYSEEATELFHILCTGEDTRKEFMVRSIDESMASHYLAQIVNALEYIHKKGKKKKS